MFKRSISFILAILTVITVFSVLPVSAAQTNVSGSQQVNEEQVVAVGATEPVETQPATELHHATEPTQPSTAAVTEATEATQVSLLNGALMTAPRYTAFIIRITTASGLVCLQKT